jgi:hypothetical protein
MQKCHDLSGFLTSNTSAENGDVLGELVFLELRVSIGTDDHWLGVT